jgi:hypothetical protein
LSRKVGIVVWDEDAHSWLEFWLVSVVADQGGSWPEKQLVRVEEGI